MTSKPDFTSIGDEIAENWTPIDEAIVEALRKAQDAMFMREMLSTSTVQTKSEPLTWEGLMASVDAGLARDVPTPTASVPIRSFPPIRSFSPMLAPIWLIESDHMVERVLHARSPARAKRRMRRGYPQHYVTRPMRTAYQLENGTLVMHPEMAALVKAATGRND